MPLPEAMILNSRFAPPPPVQPTFPALPDTLSATEVRAWVASLSKAIEDCEIYDPTELQEFVHWALKQSYSVHLHLEERLELLHIAWRVQKFLWSNPAI